MSNTWFSISYVNYTVFFNFRFTSLFYKEGLNYEEIKTTKMFSWASFQCFWFSQFILHYEKYHDGAINKDMSFYLYRQNTKDLR